MELSQKENKKMEASFDGGAPDGGFWAWAICLASFSCNLILDGVVYSFGVLLLPIMTYYDSSRSSVSWVGSLLPGIYMCTGPIAAGLVNAFGCRPVCMMGGLISSLALLLSIFSPNVPALMFIYGTCGGFGIGLTYLPSVVACGHYFDKKRALATSIAVCGSSFGCFVFAPLASHLLSVFGSWKAVNVIFSGLLLNCCVFGAFMRPLKTRSHSKKDDGNLLPSILEEEEESSFRPRLLTDRRSTIATDRNASMYLNKPKELIRNVSASKLETMKTEEKSLKIIRPLSKKDIFYSGSVMRLNSRGRAVSVISLPPVEENGFKVIVKEMINFSHFKNPLFALICASNAFGFLSMYIPYIYLPNMMTSLGKGEISQGQASFVVSAIGVSNTGGRILLGFMTDFHWVNSLILSNISLLLSGFCILVFPLCSSYRDFLITSLSLGFSLSGFLSLISIVLADIFGIESLTSTFGSLVLFRGIATILGPPLAGAVYDIFGQYNPAFMMAGSFFILAALLGQIAYHWNRYRR
uniref:Monocarboxylate transporter 12like [Nasonia vitripennis] n=1 Tax=Lepeophtheirus salmonis TaxID=72036 RepID=A0A0K2T9N2_LEPSM